VTDTAGNSSTASASLAILPPPSTTTTTTQAPSAQTTYAAPPAPSTSSPPSAQPTTFLSKATESGLSISTVTATSPLTTAFSLTPPNRFSLPRTPATESRTDSHRSDQINLTQGGSGNFRILLVGDRQTAGTESLVVYRGVADQAIVSSGMAEISVPADAFAHSDPHAAIQLSAYLVDGQPLPNWMNFDAQTGKFIVQATSGVSGELSVKVVARDSEGHEVSAIFKIRLLGKRPGQALLDQPGRPGLSEQIRLAARHPGSPDSIERIAKLSRAAQAARAVEGFNT